MITIEINGWRKVNANLLRLHRRYGEAAIEAIREEAEIEMTEAKKRTPVDTGALRDSGFVEMPDADEPRAVLGFGGPAVPYALHVHENLEAFHPVGQAKFLESVLLESVPHFARRVADTIRRKMNF